MQQIKNIEIWNVGTPKILCLEIVIFLYELFTKSVMSGSKHPKIGKFQPLQLQTYLATLRICQLSFLVKNFGRERSSMDMTFQKIQGYKIKILQR